MQQLWRRLPVIVRALVAGLVVNSLGHEPAGILFFANLRLWPTIPWSVAPIVLYLVLFWRYFSGHGWPASTAEARAESLAARPLSPRVWRWALVAGGLALAALAALHLVLAPITPPTYAVFYDLFRRLPFLTLVLIVFTLSAVAGVVEEAAYRGYMQGPIDRRHGAFVAISITTVSFVVMHFTDMQAMSAPRTLFIAVASVIYGILTHLTGSILPAIILHGVGDAFGILLLWVYWAYGATGRQPAGFAVAFRTSLFWVNVAELVVLTLAAAWAFRKLADAARSEKA